MKTLIIIPAYNEALNIKGVIEDIREHTPGADIMVIDDGSLDNTADAARGQGVSVISLPFNMGIGSAVQTGYRYAHMMGYDAAVQFDGDGQHRADQLAALIKPVTEGDVDICIGSRFKCMGQYDSEVARIAGIQILSRVISLFAGQKITDPTSGFRAANRNVVRFFCKYYPDDYPEPEALVLLRRAGFRIGEVPVRMRKRTHGNSSITFVKGLYYMIKVLLAIMIDMMKRV